MRSTVTGVAQNSCSCSARWRCIERRGVNAARTLARALKAGIVEERPSRSAASIRRIWRSTSALPARAVATMSARRR